MKKKIFRRFKNPPGGPKRKFSLYKRFYLFLKRLYDLPPNFPDNFVMPDHEVTERYYHLENHDTLTWLGHSTFLIKLKGKTILTDPFLSDYASPVPGIGPKRFTPPGFSLATLPTIDVVLVSHDHYDHCDIRTLRHLPNKENIDVIAPLRLGRLFKKIGFKKIHQLDWHETWSQADILIRALPAYHYSKRHLLTRNTSLWASYAIECDGQRLFFSGDTAYGSVFLEIGKKYGPFDYALLSIGAYDPPEFMLASHLSPEQAVKLGQDLRAKTLVGMHWGTLILSDEPPLEPPLRFYHAAQVADYSYQDIWILNIGETRKIYSK